MHFPYFTIATLPVEFNASKERLKQSETAIFFTVKNTQEQRECFQAAAMTYVAAALTAIMQLLRLIIIANNRRR